MGDFLLDWNDSSMGLDSPHHGIPIPRSQHSQTYIRPDFLSSHSYLYDTDSPSPRPTLVPPNSLTVSGVGGTYPSSQFGYPFENQRNALSPTHYVTGSPIMHPNKVELEMEIKMEPLEDILDIQGGLSSHDTSHHPPEDNLLDNVNFEDLLMADDMDSSQTPCLDPQHSSPAAMATVHPDEVFGLMRTEPSPAYNPIHPFTPSVSVPVKAENPAFGGLATSFPPQGIGWKENSLPNQNTLGNCPNPTLYQNIANPQLQQHLHHQQQQQQPASAFKDGLQHPSRLLVSMGKSSPQEPQQPTMTYHGNTLSSPSNINNNNNNEEKPLYTQLESASSTSALHDLLISSPSTSLSPQQPAHLQLSPQSTGSNLSPVSPLRGLSQEIPIGQSVPGVASFLAARSSSLSSRLSSSAPVNDFSLEQIWQRREPRQHLLSTGSLVEEVGGSTSSLSTGGGILSPAPNDLSIDEEIDSEDDSDVDHYDSDSDNDSIMSEEMTSLGSSGSKKERHFWQYNVQAKGPKGHRVSITQDESDPHQLAKIMDPVFSPLCSIQGIKHSGKARRGDGNDLTPSPRKLVNIGLELGKLNKKINEMTPVSELPSTVRNKSRKEKNKLASRACRLKKKAQHEANKIKLYGLEQEHQGMLNLLIRTREELFKKVEIAQNPNATEVGYQQESSPRDSFLSLGSPGVTMGNPGGAQMQQILTSHIEKVAKMRSKQRIAGFTTEFVNKVIENCRNGNPSGGLDELSQTFAKTSLFNSYDYDTPQSNEGFV